jgi:hypothetical protein
VLAPHAKSRATITTMSRSAWLAIFAVGCGARATPSSAQVPASVGPGSSSAAPAGPVALSDDLPRLAARARELYLAWRGAFADGSMDCANATIRTNEVADRFADVTDANRVVWRAGHARIKAFRAELDKYDAEIGPAAKAVMESPIMGRCVDDPAFARAIERLAGEG